MLKKILNIGFYLVLIYLVAVTFFMDHQVKEVKAENKQLQLDKEELRLELVDTQIQRDEAVDANWQLSNQLERMEGE